MDCLIKKEHQDEMFEHYFDHPLESLTDRYLTRFSLHLP